MKPRASYLLPLTLLATALPAFAQPATAPANPVPRELIYCADQMNHDEREAHRAKMQAARTPEAKKAVRTAHRREMQERARAAGREGECEPNAQSGRGQGYRGGQTK